MYKMCVVLLSCVLSLTIVSCASQKAPLPGKVLKLDGVGDYMEIPTHAPINGSSGTIATWIFPERLSKTHHILHAGEPTGNGGGTEDEFHLQLSPPTGVSLVLVQDRSIVFTVTAQDVIEPGNWCYVAATWDGSLVKLYANGSPVANGNYSAQMSKHKWAQWMRIGFCNDKRGTGDDVNRFFNGAIDEVRIWNIALTREEIRRSMNAKLTGKEEGMLAYWNFDDSSARDLSSNGNDGTLFGDAQIVETILIK